MKTEKGVDKDDGASTDREDDGRHILLPPCILILKKERGVTCV